MAIQFEQQVKKQRNFIIIFIILILTAGFILWWGLREEEPLEILTSKKLKQIEIDFDIFNNPLLKKFQLIDKTPDFEGDIGRENPFIPF